MPSVKEEIDNEVARAFARGKTAGASDALYEIAQLRAKVAKLETLAADLRKAVAEMTAREALRMA
jgi:phage shock protein A